MAFKKIKKIELAQFQEQFGKSLFDKIHTTVVTGLMYKMASGKEIQSFVDNLVNGRDLTLTRYDSSNAFETLINNPSMLDLQTAKTNITEEDIITCIAELILDDVTSLDTNILHKLNLPITVKDVPVKHDAVEASSETSAAAASDGEVAITPRQILCTALIRSITTILEGRAIYIDESGESKIFTLEMLSTNLEEGLQAEKALWRVYPEDMDAGPASNDEVESPTASALLHKHTAAASDKDAQITSRELLRVGFTESISQILNGDATYVDKNGARQTLTLDMLVTNPEVEKSAREAWEAEMFGDTPKEGKAAAETEGYSDADDVDHVNEAILLEALEASKTTPASFVDQLAQAMFKMGIEGFDSNGITEEQAADALIALGITPEM